MTGLPDRAASATAGDPASCSALGACLLAGARRLRPTHPELSMAMAPLGAELQRYAVSLRASELLEAYADPTASDRPPAVARMAAARRGRAEAGLRRVAAEAGVRFESVVRSRAPRGPDPGEPDPHEEDGR